MNISEFTQKYSPQIPFFEETWTELNNIEGVSLRIEVEGLKNYGQVLFTACETVSTCYNNYYMENFENIVSNYFIYMLHGAFSSIVYDHVLNDLFSSVPVHITAGNISNSLNEQTQKRVRIFLNPLMLKIRNRLPSLPVRKEMLNSAPFNIMPTLRYIREKY
ncbi:uncharacterized protein BX663DRAFT_441175 [Cokeromyces recurvatus]|uniref:uncharacterized protein n=1 Tax=Cokeromyces recurvatus TaxID=90255 RepID=UPI00221F0B5E|nr:uncharacterized protein BX663DRAFT_441175 [Cokeromyces recurvatus]KAI7899455.1 hypothetical protein BX663DRAFT_441175 [Cokeromyces recurvatus]